MATAGFELTASWTRSWFKWRLRPLGYLAPQVWHNVINLILHFSTKTLSFVYTKTFYRFFLVSHLRLSQRIDDTVVGWLNHFIVITLYQNQYTMITIALNNYLTLPQNRFLLNSSQKISTLMKPRTHRSNIMLRI